MTPPATRRGHPVLVVTVAALAVYAAAQALVAWSVTSDSWWRVEWVRLHVRLKHPHAVYAQQLPRPRWEDWLPSTVTGLVSVGALVLLALLLAAAGRGWWLLVVAALPLVPVELAPGVWAPPLENVVAYALVWRPGATLPAPAWAWGSAALAALTVAVPAATLHVASYGREARVPTGTVLRRLLPAALAAAAVLWWQNAADVPLDLRALAWGAAVTLTGALVASGLRRPRHPAVRAGFVVVALALLPPLAGGALTWTTAVTGPPSWTVDPSARGLAVAALGGAAWVLLAPAVAALLGRTWSGWRAVVIADVEARNASRAVRPRPSRGAPVPAGGRHRA